MIHPATCVRYIDDRIGHGVFATAFIPKGTILWVTDPLDRVFTSQELDSFHPMQREMVLNHSFRNRDGHFVFCWDHTRYVNHSFEPNSYPTAYGLELAICDIQEGDQITNDYGFLNIIEPFEPVAEGVGRGIVHPDDLTKYADMWDDTLRQIFPEVTQVDQPLWPILKESVQQELLGISQNPSDMRSVVNLWCGQR